MGQRCRTKNGKVSQSILAPSFLDGKDQRSLTLSESLRVTKISRITEANKSESTDYKEKGAKEILDGKHVWHASSHLDRDRVWMNWYYPRQDMIGCS